MKKAAAILLLAALCLSGCAGYHIGPIQPKYMAGIKTLAVPSFKNDTLTPRLEVLAADMLIRQIQQDGTYEIVSSDKADAIIEGTISNIRRYPARSLQKDVLTTTEFTVTVTLSYSITRRDTGEKIKTNAADGTSSFYVGSDTPTSTIASIDPNEGQRQAMPLAIKEAVVRLVSQISEGW